MRRALLCCVIGVAFAASTTSDVSGYQTSSVRPLDARHSPFIDGNASPRLPAGRPGRIDVIVVGRYDAATELLPFIIRNNRRRTADSIEIGLSVTSRSGDLLETDPPAVLFPTVLRPGEIAFGVFSINREYVPAGARFEFRFVQEPSLQVLLTDQQVTNTRLVNGRVAGTARNTGKELAAGPIGTGVLCFTETGAISRYHGGERHTSLGPGEKIRFRVPLRGRSCPTFLVGAQGS